MTLLQPIAVPGSAGTLEIVIRTKCRECGHTEEFPLMVVSKWEPEKEKGEENADR